jgi:hypothetical protein
MKKLQILAVLAVAAIVLAIVPATFAQNQPPTFGLSDTDYALLQSANQATFAAKSFQFDYTLSLNASVAASSSAGANATPEVTSGTITGSGGLDISASDSPLFQITAQGSLTANGSDTPFNVEARVANKNIYFNATGQDTGWQGVAIADIPNLFSSMMGGMGGMLPVNPSEISGAMQPGGQSQMMQQFAPLMQAMSAIKPEDFVGITRTDESGLAHFAINVDLKKFITSPEVMQAMVAAQQASGSATSGSTGGAASGMNPQQMMQMAQTLIQTASLTVDQYVDTTSNMVTRDTITLDLNVMSMSGGAPTTANVNFDLKLHDFNTAFAVEAPANATMIPVPTPEAGS